MFHIDIDGQVVVPDEIVSLYKLLINTGHCVYLYRDKKCKKNRH